MIRTGTFYDQHYSISHLYLVNNYVPIFVLFLNQEPRPSK